MSTLPPVRPTLDDCGQRIDAKYNELGHSLGWRFLGGPRRTFNGSTLFAIITLNPGGYAEDPAHPRLSSEAGSSYWIESWRGRRSGAAPLQRQVQELFVRIAGIVGATESAREFVESHVLVAHFVPFRSPKGAALLRRGVFALFMGLFARGCVSPVLISGGQQPSQHVPASFRRPAEPRNGTEYRRSVPLGRAPFWTFARRSGTVPWAGGQTCDGCDDRIPGT